MVKEQGERPADIVYVRPGRMNTPIDGCVASRDEGKPCRVHRARCSTHRCEWRHPQGVYIVWDGTVPGVEEVPRMPPTMRQGFF